MSPHKTSVLNAAETYFSNINPIASRIYADFEETKNSYECVWNTLSSDEQTQILNECIIKPEVTLQYSLKPSAFPDKNFNNSEVFGKKRVVDENVSYRDEHSAPFSFKTLSQVDLRVFTKDDTILSVTPKVLTPKAQPPPLPPLVGPMSCSSSSDSSSTSLQHTLMASPLSSVDTTTTQLTDDATAALLALPKTGLDFLDNW